MNKTTYVEARFGNYGMEHIEAITLIEYLGYRWVNPEFNSDGELLVNTGIWSLTARGLTLKEKQEKFDKESDDLLTDLFEKLDLNNSKPQFFGIDDKGDL